MIKKFLGAVLVVGCMVSVLLANFSQAMDGATCFEDFDPISGLEARYRTTLNQYERRL